MAKFNVDLNMFVGRRYGPAHKDRITYKIRHDEDNFSTLRFIQRNINLTIYADHDTGSVKDLDEMIEQLTQFRDEISEHLDEEGDA